MNMLSSFVGAWIALLLFGVAVVVGVIGICGQLAAGSSVQQVKSDSVLKLELKGEITETELAEAPDYRSLLQGDFEVPQTLDAILEGLREGAKNEDIKALYIECNGVSAAPATLDAIRKGVLEFKASGKKVYAYGDGLAMGDYLVASAADKVFMNPEGEFNMNGLGSTSLYMKGLYDKIGVTFQVVKVGTFKSAVEPYIMQEMSEPARAQLDTLYGNMWKFIRREIASTRKKTTAAKIDSLVNGGISYSPAERAVKAGLVDSLVYGRQMNDILAGVVGVKKTEDLNFVSPQTLVSQTPWANAVNAKNQIAVLYACGEIVDGSPSGLNYETLVPQIVKLAEDDNVKGMVLRVNSPGGSAFGSAQIGEALDFFMSKGKPLAVSMGDYAASGGYWISCCSDIIFADALTITGSIGIFGLIPNAAGLMNKVGVNPQTVSTNPAANFPTFFKPMDERQLALMQKYVDRGYETFVGRVAKGRKMSVDRVKAIAEGRVWDAVKARQIGLVDSIAGMNHAVEWVARKADILDKYNVAPYPEVKPNLWTMLSMSSQTFAKFASIQDEPSFSKFVCRHLEMLSAMGNVQARMPQLTLRLY